MSSGLQRYTIVKNAIKLGFTGIGVAGGFVHVDIRATDTPVMWAAALFYVLYIFGMALVVIQPCVETESLFKITIFS